MEKIEERWQITREPARATRCDASIGISIARTEQAIGAFVRVEKDNLEKSMNKTLLNFFAN